MITSFKEREINVMQHVFDQKEIVFQILSEVGNPLCLSLVCSKFKDCSKQLLVNLFSRLNLIPESYKVSIEDFSARKCLHFLTTNKMDKYSDAEIITQDASEHYNKMEISAIDCLKSVKKWIVFRDEFAGKSVKVTKTDSDELAFPDVIYVNPMGDTLLDNEYCFLQGENSLVLPVKPLISLKADEIGLNNYQRWTLLLATDDPKNMNFIHINNIPLVARLVLEVLANENLSTLFLSNKEENIKSLFLRKFNGHVLNENHRLRCETSDKGRIVFRVISFKTKRSSTFGILDSFNAKLKFKNKQM